jgi:hypothetical protein
MKKDSVSFLFPFCFFLARTVLLSSDTAVENPVVHYSADEQVAFRLHRVVILSAQVQ